MLKGFVTVLSLVAGMSTALASQSNGVLVPSPSERVFVPLGFDDNDNVEVVVYGHFRNSCYKVGPSEVHVDAQKKLIEISPQAYTYPNALCAQMLVPFQQTVKLGSIDAGTYRVVVANNVRVPAQTLVVNPRHTESPDDYLYAPVDEAHIEYATDGTQTLSLRGNYPLTFVGCAIMREVQVRQMQDDVLVVLPIMDMIPSEQECAARHWAPSFSEQVTLPLPLTEGLHLIHVRVLNGNSYNSVIEVSGQ